MFSQITLNNKQAPVRDVINKNIMYTRYLSLNCYYESLFNRITESQRTIDYTLCSFSRRIRFIVINTINRDLKINK